MAQRYRAPLCAMVVIALAALASGCSAITTTETVKASDTYDVWSSRMDHMPFLFHFPGGLVEVFDDHGDVLAGMSESKDPESGNRVDIYVDERPSASMSLCDPMADEHLSTIDPKGPNVVSALCENTRSVVSFTDHARPRVLAARSSYVARARHLLLDGIWTSVAQTPDPLPQ